MKPKINISLLQTLINEYSVRASRVYGGRKGKPNNKSSKEKKYWVRQYNKKMRKVKIEEME